MSNLEPIDTGIHEEGRALAQALRTLFDALDISMRRYATRCHTDFGTVSRYLSGKRVPPWSFVKELLANVSEHRGQPTSDEAVRALRQMHARALGTGKGTRKVVELQQLLEEADQQVLEANSLERLLRQALREQEQQISQLTVELQSLRASRAQDRQSESKEVDLLFAGYQDLKDEREELLREISFLKKQLHETTAARILAEARCEQLEHQIEEAETQELREASNDAERAQEKADQATEQLLRERAAASARLSVLEEQLSTLRKNTQSTPPGRGPLRSSKVADQLDDDDSLQLALSDSADSLAAKIGYAPGQVLRRVYSATKVNPGKVEAILARAIDIQTPEEVALTTELLRTMPGYVAFMFRDLRMRTSRPDINPPIGTPQTP
nr:hypothetical protein [Streptomyces sp. DSM 41633]